MKKEYRKPAIIDRYSLPEFTWGVDKNMQQWTCRETGKTISEDEIIWAVANKEWEYLLERFETYELIALVTQRKRYIENEKAFDEKVARTKSLRISADARHNFVRQFDEEDQRIVEAFGE